MAIATIYMLFAVPTQISSLMDAEITKKNKNKNKTKTKQTKKTKRKGEKMACQYVQYTVTSVNK